MKSDSDDFDDSQDGENARIRNELASKIETFIKRSSNAQDQPPKDIPPLKMAGMHPIKMLEIMKVPTPRKQDEKISEGDSEILSGRYETQGETSGAMGDIGQIDYEKSEYSGFEDEKFDQIAQIA